MLSVVVGKGRLQGPMVKETEDAGHRWPISGLGSCVWGKIEVF